MIYELDGYYRSCNKLTWPRHVRATLIPNLRLIGQPFDALAKSIHIGELEDINDHYNLVVPSAVRIGKNKRGEASSQQMCNCKASQFGITVSQMGYSTDVIDTIDEFTDLCSVSVRPISEDLEN